MTLARQLESMLDSEVSLLLFFYSDAADFLSNPIRSKTNDGITINVSREIRKLGYFKL